MPQGLSDGVRKAVGAYLKANPGATKAALAGALGISRQALHAYLKSDKPALPRASVLQRLSELTGGIEVDGWRCGPKQFRPGTQAGAGPVAVLRQQRLPFAAPVKIAADDRSIRAEVRRSFGDELVIAVHLKLG